MLTLLKIHVQVSVGFDEVNRLDTVSLALAVDKKFKGGRNPHDCYALALVLTTDLALSLHCSEDQVLIQDIFEVGEGTTVLLCLASSEMHAEKNSAHALGLKLMRDVHCAESDVRSLVPSIVAVDWIPDRALTGLNGRFQSELTGATNRSQLSHLDTQRAGADEIAQHQKLVRVPHNTISGGSILRIHKIKEPKRLHKNRNWDNLDKWESDAKKWDKVPHHVSINLTDKVAEANCIFDRLDADGNGMLTNAEVVTGMLDNGFAEDEVMVRLPSVFKAMDEDEDGTVSRNEFVEYWVKSKDDDPNRLFDRFDCDGNGSLSRAEVRAGLLQEGYYMKEIQQRLPSIFKQVDTDGDDSISRKEFVQHWSKSREAGFAGIDLGQMTGLVKWANQPVFGFKTGTAAAMARKSVMKSLPPLPPAVKGLTDQASKMIPSYPFGSRGTEGSEEQEAQGAAGVFAGIMSTSSDVFGMVGNTMIQPLPEHLQDMIMPLPRDSAPQAHRAFTTRIQRYEESRATTAMRRPRISPREMLARALGPQTLGANAEAENTEAEKQGWASMLRSRLGAGPPNTDLAPAVGSMSIGSFDPMSIFSGQTLGISMFGAAPAEINQDTNTSPNQNALTQTTSKATKKPGSILKASSIKGDSSLAGTTLLTVSSGVSVKTCTCRISNFDRTDISGVPGDDFGSTL
jgi:Ca2+-binding EF-hand superfamily protein